MRTRRERVPDSGREATTGWLVVLGRFPCGQVVLILLAVLFLLLVPASVCHGSFLELIGTEAEAATLCS